MSHDRVVPARYWSASPTYNQWCKLTAHDIAHTLTDERGFEGQNVLFYNAHPIRYAYLTGLLVSIEPINDRTTLAILDDGSGTCIELVVRTHPAAPDAATAPTSVEGLVAVKTMGLTELLLHGTSLRPGTVIKAKGTLTSFAGMRQIALRRVLVVPDTADEAAAWRATSLFKDEVLGRRWVLDGVERQRMDAEAARAASRAAAKESLRGAREMLREEQRRERRERHERHRARAEAEMNAGAIA